MHTVVQDVVVVNAQGFERHCIGTGIAYWAPQDAIRLARRRIFELEFALFSERAADHAHDCASLYFFDDS
jgi:hypothetical protein